MATNLISRYPGVVPFSERQQDLFRGRDKEKAELYSLVVAEQTVVLFAKSGVGKSSLLQAGLFPKLRKNGYHPIKVRFQYTSVAEENDKEKIVIRKTPLQILFETLEQRAQAEDDHVAIRREKILFNKDAPRLWELIKVIELPDVQVVAEPVVQEVAVAQSQVSAASVLQPEEDEEVKKISSMLGQFIPDADQISTVRQTPVLVFDQFEEFFNFPESERNEFMTQLREVLHNLTPNRIGEWLRGFKLLDRTPERLEWAKQPVMKCIISIRDDKLSELDSLRSYIPLILRNRYKLSALTQQNAAEAMEIPAALKDEDRFISPPFTFDTTTRDKILNRLAGADIDERLMFQQAQAVQATNTNAPAVDKGIDGSQLQKVCSDIENRVIRASKTKNPVVVDGTIINADRDVQAILDNFYAEQLKKLGSEKEVQLCRNIIEQHLVSGQSRASLTRAQIDRELKGRSELLEKMINARLIKEEYTHLGQTFELSHDSLIRSVAKYARENKLQILNRDKKRYIWLFIISGVLFLVALILGLRIFSLLNQNNLKLAESYYQQNNHYTAYNIWDKFRSRWMVSPFKKDSINKTLDSLSLFDIAGGDKLVRLSDWSMAVHEKDNTIHLWKIPGDGGRLQVKTILDAYNLEASYTKRYLGYRTKNGTLMIYDAHKDSSFRVEFADMTPMQGRRTTLADPDYKMGFLTGADFVGYIDSTGQVYIYNLDSRARIRLRIRKEGDNSFYSNFLESRLKISADKRFVIVHKADSFTIWNIANTKELPVRQHAVKGISASYFFAKGDSYCYQKRDTFFIVPFKEGAPVYRSRVRTFPSFSPDHKRCMFYNTNLELVIFNMEKNMVEVIVRDNAGNAPLSNNYYGNNMRQMSMQMSMDIAEPVWVDEGDKIYYQNRRGNNILFSVSQQRNILDYSVYSPDGRYYCRLKTTGELKLYDRRTGGVLYTDTIARDSFAGMSTAYQYARFSSSGTLLAYQVMTSKEQGYLKVVDFTDSAHAVKYQSRNLWSIGDFFTKDFIAVYDELGNPGLLFMNGRTRNKKYYQQLYPRLEENEKDRLGVRDFRDIINLFKPI